ncbi:2-carboxy-1,4-naphthoquinone phytyltransferase [Euhalothece natronophila Z-M001]|uniref:2-carboxy-1,4-naphthoquinone phytyltransferase n=1 Tax=Euhalothece natronophila Z-M001 TaxID=522448 RepID=A0A5B8NST5_9CHRO|nr:2-carboxy-1,4-naphthoquinone phytyltransferase [Euhalothece natronophila]QDZ41419.1 2-carboxy-1,4-naphthoquinone phytyltransferase [Euhalothece natronophila Z-M001]
MRLTHFADNSVKKINTSLWLAAIKPPIYSVAIIPITMGTLAAYRDTGEINLPIFSLFILSGILIIAWLNLSNDVFDSETGIDVNKSSSVVNITGNKQLVFRISNICLGLAILGLSAIAWLQQDWQVILLVLLACFLGYTYQGPPFRLGYQGLGEFICFICFGPIAIAAAYYSQAQVLTPVTLPTAILIGISTTIILFCSHFHQVQDDILAGKKSPIVRLGTKQGANVLMILTASMFALTVLWWLLGYFPLSSLLIFLAIPSGQQLVSHVQKYHDQPSRVSNSKFIAVKFYIWSSVFLALGLIAPTFFS